MTSKAKPAQQAKPYIKAPRKTDVAKIHVTRSTTTSMQGSSGWATAPAVQAASVVWNQKADALEANAKVIADFRSKLKIAEANQSGLRRDWSIATDHMIATVAIQCGGSADDAHGFGFDVLTHTPVGLLPAPQDLTTKPGKAVGELVLSWKRGIATHGFIVQHAVDVANPATVSAPVPCTRTKYTLKGALSSSVVHLRVAAIDPIAEEGHSPWSDWVAGTVR